MAEAILYNCLILLLGVSSIRFNKVVENIHDSWIKNVNSYRGIMALLIVCGHVSITVSDSAPYHLLAKMAYIIVGYFFFVSGISIAMKYTSLDNYINRAYWTQKILYMLIVAVIIWGFELTIQSIMGVKVFNIKSTCIFINLFDDVNWYIWELFVFYIVLYICLECFGKTGGWILLGISLVCVTGIYIMDFPAVYYKSALAFPIGVVMGMDFDKRIKESFTNIIGLLLLVVVGVIFYISGISLFKEVYLSNIVCIVAIALLTEMAFYFECTGKIARFLTKISSGIYFTQFVWLKTLKFFIKSFEMRLIMVLICTIISAIIFNLLMKPIKCCLRRIVIKS